jgi:hypothetical protein
MYLAVGKTRKQNCAQHAHRDFWLRLPRGKASQFPTSLNRAHPNSTKMGMQEFSYSHRKILSTREFSFREPVQKMRNTMRSWHPE